MKEFKNRRLLDGRKMAVHNGCLPEREMQTTIGLVKVQIHKSRSGGDGRPATFHPVPVPPYIHKSRSFKVSLSWLYLKDSSRSYVLVAIAQKKW